MRFGARGAAAVPGGARGFGVVGVSRQMPACDGGVHSSLPERTGMAPRSTEWRGESLDLPKERVLEVAQVRLPVGSPLAASLGEPPETRESSLSPSSLRSRLDFRAADLAGFAVLFDWVFVFVMCRLRLRPSSGRYHAAAWGRRPPRTTRCGLRTPYRESGLVTLPLGGTASQDARGARSPDTTALSPLREPFCLDNSPRDLRIPFPHCLRRTAAFLALLGARPTVAAEAHRVATATRALR
jgi:hypothetical protein